MLTSLFPIHHLARSVPESAPQLGHSVQWKVLQHWIPQSLELRLQIRPQLLQLVEAVHVETKREIQQIWTDFTGI